MSTTSYRLVASVNRIRPRGSAEERCGILIDAMSDEGQGDDDEVLDDTPVLLRVAASVVDTLVVSELNRGCSWLVVPPADFLFRTELPARVRDAAQSNVLMQVLRRYSHNPMLFPTSLWSMPADGEREFGSLVQSLSDAGWDPALAAAYFDAGGVRASLQRSSITLSCICSATQRLRGQLEDGIRSTGLTLSWLGE